MEMHNAEMAYTFALGSFFLMTPGGRRLLKRFKRFLDLAVQLDVNRPARAFNWAFQFRVNWSISCSTRRKASVESRMRRSTVKN